MDFVAIDFEASCLPRHGRSFPIEVGICGREGEKSWLIKPHGLWQEWDWTDEAARLHGITLETLDREGVMPEIVLAELTAAIGERRVIADSDIDAHWWATLANTARPSAPCRIEHASVLLDELGATSAEIIMAAQHADRRCPVRHRAGPDAHWLWSALAELEWIAAARIGLRKAA